MIKTLNRTLKQDRERFTLPKNVQDIIPVQSVYPDGIFQTGKNKFSKTFRFEDINYYVASAEDKKAMFLGYSEILNRQHCSDEAHYKQPQAEQSGLQEESPDRHEGRQP